MKTTPRNKAEAKPGLIIPLEIFTYIRKRSLKEAGIFFHALIRYGLHGEEVSLDSYPVLQMIFERYRERMDHDTEAYWKAYGHIRMDATNDVVATNNMSGYNDPLDDIQEGG